MVPTFYHGGRARVRPGGVIKPGHRANSWGDRPFERSTHVYASTDLMTAASYAKETGGQVYEVEPTGPYVYDPYGGNESIMTEHPMTVIRKVPLAEWDYPAPRY